MKYIILLALVLAIAMPTMAQMKITLTPNKMLYNTNENIVIKVQIEEREEDATWDTYLFFKDSRNTPYYITLNGTEVNPTVLGMLPAELTLKPTFWKQREAVVLHVYACAPNTQNVIATACTKFGVNPPYETPQYPLPMTAQLRLVQQLSAESSRAYTDYKQFNSSWKNTTMGASNGTTIGASGCAITSVGNIRGATPVTINSELQQDGGYSGNSLYWGKVRGLSFKGNGSISDSLFSSYHVVADVGGHWVLLTGVSSPGSYSSHDPGKSYNPTYSSGQIYSVRLYYK